jgi:hypothetical protein
MLKQLIVLLLAALVYAQCAETCSAAALDCSAGNVLCVDDTPGPSQEYSSIQTCTNAAVAGDTCLVFPGNYNERVTFPSGYHGGEPGNRIVFKANTTGTVVMRGFNTRYANYIRIEGFNITNSLTGWSEGEGIFVWSNDVEVLDNYVYNINGTGITTYSHPPYSRNISIINNTVYRSQAGIVVFCDDCLIDSNEVNRLYDYDNFFMSDNDYARLFGSNIVVRNNYFHGSIAGEVGNAHMDCFMAFDYNDEYAYNIIIENNICTDFEQVISSGSVNGRIKNFTWRNNLFYNGWGNGLNLKGGALNKGIEYNYVYNNVFANIRYFGGLYKSDSYTFAKNNIFYNTRLISYDFAGDPSSQGDYNLMLGTNYPSSPGAHDIMGSDPLFRNLNKGLVFEDWNDTAKSNYIYNSSSFYTKSFRNDFVLGDSIEYCSYYTGCDNIARRVTSIYPYSDGYMIIFTPAIENLLIPDCRAALGLCSNCGYLKIWGSRSWDAGEQIPMQDKVIDLRLLSSSPAVNGGTDLSDYFTADKDGTARPQGPAWDIGAYEYAGEIQICDPNTYYIDYENGNDANSGACTTSAWKHAPGDDNAEGNAGLAELSSGDIVYFKRGVAYIGQINTRSDGVTYTVTDWGTGDAIINGSGMDACFSVNHNNITIDGGEGGNLVITGDVNHAGIWNWGNWNLNGSVFTRLNVTRIGSASSEEGIGIKIGGNSYAYTNYVISYSTISYCYSAAIKVSGSGTRNIDIHNNTIENSGDKSGEDTEVNFSSNVGSGVQNVTFHDNIVRFGPGNANGVNCNNANNEIYDNEIYGNGGYGLSLNPGYNANYNGAIKVYRNRIYLNSGYGAAIGGADINRHAEVYNNLFYNNSNYEINIMSGSSYNRLFFNTVYHNIGGHGIRVQSGSVSNMIKSNVVWVNGGYVLYDSSGSIIEDYNLFTRNSGYDVVIWNGNMYGSDIGAYRTASGQGRNSAWNIDPQFMNPAASDLRVKTGSPAIDTGVDNNIYDDFDEMTRPFDGDNNGTAEFDIGAYEFASGLQYHRSDANLDGCIGLSEMVAFMNRWKVSVADVTMPEMMESIGLWKAGSGC